MTDRTPLAGRKEYPLIDTVKFIAAVVVVAMHINPCASYGFYSDSVLFWAINDTLVRFAVPFFFVSSGFLFFRKADPENLDIEISKHFLAKNLRLYATWLILLIFGANNQLWFMSGLVVAVTVLSILFYRGVSLKTVAVISVFLYIIGLSGDLYSGFFEPLKNIRIFTVIINVYNYLFNCTRCGVFMGIPFVVMGAVFARNNIRLSKKAAVAGLIISVILQFFEMYIIKSVSEPFDTNMSISLLPLSFFLFSLCMGSDAAPKPYHARLRAVGVLTYFSHFLFYQLVRWFFGFLREYLYIDITNSTLYFALTLTVTLCASFAIEKLSRNEKLPLLKYLYK